MYCCYRNIYHPVYIYLSSYAYKASLCVRHCCLTLTCSATDQSPTPHVLSPCTLGCPLRFHTVQHLLVSSCSHTLQFLCSEALFPSCLPSGLASHMAALSHHYLYDLMFILCATPSSEGLFLAPLSPALPHYCSAIELPSHLALHHKILWNLFYSFWLLIPDPEPVMEQIF